MTYEMSRRGAGASEPFREMVPLRAVMDRLFESAFMPSFLGEARLGGTRGLGIDVDEDDDRYYVSCPLPGIDPNDVEIEVHDNVLRISGETRQRTREGRRPLVQETSYGRFERQVALPAAVDAGRAEASYEHGVLEIRVPKAESSRPRTIRVNAGMGTQARAAGTGAGAGASTLTPGGHEAHTGDDARDDASEQRPATTRPD